MQPGASTVDRDHREAAWRNTRALFALSAAGAGLRLLTGAPLALKGKVIVGMAGGRIVFDGPPAKLSDATLRTIYGGEDWLH